MAIVTGFEKAEPRQVKAHPTRVVGHWSTAEIDGKKLFQLDTRGSPERQSGEKQSQTIQLSAAAASELVDILRREFNLN